MSLDRVATNCRKLLVPVLLSLLLPIPSVVQALNIGLNFTGSTFATDTQLSPPDSMGAAGPDHFVELINGRYSVYRNADGLRAQTTTLDGFWQGAGVTPAGSDPRGSAFDSRVVYDPSSTRWFAISVDNARGPNNFLVAASNSSNPMDGWKGFAIPSDTTKTHSADFPTLGVSRDAVYVAANMDSVTPGGSRNTGILVLPKADLIAGTVANRTLFENVDASRTGLFVQGTTSLNGVGGPVGILLSDNNTPGQFKRSDVVGSVTMPVLDPTNKFVSVPPFGFPPDAQQPGPKQSLNTLGMVFGSSIVMRNGELWGVQSVDVAGRSALRWFDLNAATNTLRQTGLIALPTLDFYYGSIAVNEFGDVVIGFSGSGKSQFASVYGVEGRTIGGVTTFGDPVLLKAGVSDYLQPLDPSGRNRWGDYSATTLDPDDPFTFWTIQEWVSATDIWSTQITEIHLEPIPEPTTLLLCGTAMAGLGLTARWRGRGQN
jgi:hypothetical protein